MMVGFYVVIDDVIQHYLGVETPLRRVNNWLWKTFSIYQKLTEFMDRIFGKKE